MGGRTYKKEWGEPETVGCDLSRIYPVVLRVVKTLSTEGTRQDDYRTTENLT